MRGKKTRDEANKIKFSETMKEFTNMEHRSMLRAKNTGSWLLARGTTVTGTVLSGVEFHDFLCARYNLTPPTSRKMRRLFPIILRRSHT